jgi:hypothetical protein
MSTRTGKGKKRRRIGRRTDKRQSEAFVKAAKEAGLESAAGEAFARTMDKLLKPPKRGSN